jgi:hypothetical protein
LPVLTVQKVECRTGIELHLLRGVRAKELHQRIVSRIHVPGNAADVDRSAVSSDCRWTLPTTHELHDRSRVGILTLLHHPLALSLDLVEALSGSVP